MPARGAAGPVELASSYALGTGIPNGTPDNYAVTQTGDGSYLYRIGFDAGVFSHRPVCLADSNLNHTMVSMDRNPHTGVSWCTLRFANKPAYFLFIAMPETVV